MINDVMARVAVVKESTAKSAYRRLDGLGGTIPSKLPPSGGFLVKAVVSLTQKSSPIPDFVLRQARRYRGRKPAPWA